MLLALRRAENALFPAVEAVVARVDASLVTEAVSEGSIAAITDVTWHARRSRESGPETLCGAEQPISGLLDRGYQQALDI